MQRQAPNRAAQKLRRWRKKQTPPMSGEDFARRIKVSRNTVYRIETGKRLPRPEAIAALEAEGICTLMDFYAPPTAEDPVDGEG